MSKEESSQRDNRCRSGEDRAEPCRAFCGTGFVLREAESIGRFGQRPGVS